ncbi:hypothetical protein AVEN_83534-1 [Araneus ventricosus]|uniref:Uncharacterized protein n=1 Tax=Araneus ventricosus TaxID=182803 RepID=A0A4Y2H602_ARAVE|nr:hypothetical protein AVEN_83534-1 [Araneus ventricosus]
MYVKRALEKKQPRCLKLCFYGVWLGKPRVARGSYLWTVVGGIPNRRAVPMTRGLANLSAALECIDGIWPFPPSFDVRAICRHNVGNNRYTCNPTSLIDSSFSDDDK